MLRGACQGGHVKGGLFRGGILSGGAYPFAACLRHLTIDHAPLLGKKHRSYSYCNNVTKTLHVRGVTFRVFSSVGRAHSRE